MAKMQRDNNREIIETIAARLLEVGQLTMQGWIHTDYGKNAAR